MKVVINSEERDVQDGLTVQTLLDSLKLRPEATVVERNQAIVDRADYPTTQLADGDALELVRFVGGG